MSAASARTITFPARARREGSASATTFCRHQLVAAEVAAIQKLPLKHIDGHEYYQLRCCLSDTKDNQQMVSAGGCTSRSHLNPTAQLVGGDSPGRQRSPIRRRSPVRQ